MLRISPRLLTISRPLLTAPIHSRLIFRGQLPVQAARMSDLTNIFTANACPRKFSPSIIFTIPKIALDSSDLITKANQTIVSSRGSLRMSPIPLSPNTQQLLPRTSTQNKHREQRSMKALPIIHSHNTY